MDQINGVYAVNSVSLSKNISLRVLTPVAMQLSVGKCRLQSVTDTNKTIY